MPPPIKSDLFRDLPFFSGLPDTLVWHLARAAERRSLAADEILFRQGETRNLMAVILKGSIVIEQQRNDSTVLISSLGTGEIVGEGVLFEDDEHGTCGRATEATELVVFPREQLTKLLKDQPALYAALLSRAAKVINERIKRANATLVGVTTGTARVRAKIEKMDKKK